MEPAGDGVRPAEAAGPAGQGQEGGLGHVLGRLVVAGGAAGDAEDHRPVPVDQLGERGLVPAIGEPADQVAVGGGRTGPAAAGTGRRWGAAAWAPRLLWFYRRVPAATAPHGRGAGFSGARRAAAPS